MENNYSIEIEDVLKAYATEAEILYVIHNKNYLHYQKRGHYYTIPVIILSTITGVLSFNQSIQSTTVGQYTIGGINILCGIITTVYKFLNYSNFENQHKLLAIEYLHLFEDIKGVLTKHPGQRPDAIGYLAKIEAKRQELFDNFSIIHDTIRNDFKKKYKNLSLPLKLNRISNIQIYGREKDDAIICIESSSELDKNEQLSGSIIPSVGLTEGIMDRVTKGAVDCVVDHVVNTGEHAVARVIEMATEQTEQAVMKVERVFDVVEGAVEGVERAIDGVSEAEHAITNITSVVESASVTATNGTVHESSI